MLQQLTQDIKLLEENKMEQKLQMRCLQNLVIQKINNFNKAIVGKRLKKSQFFLIFEFLKLKERINLRFVNRQFQVNIQLAFPFYIPKYEQEINTLQLQINEIQIPQTDYKIRLEQAKSELYNLTNAHIVEMKSLATPPTIFAQISAILIRLVQPEGIRDDWWTCVQMLSDATFLKQMQNIKIEDFTRKQERVLEKIIQYNQNQVTGTSFGIQIFYSFLTKLFEVLQDPAVQGIRKLKQLQNKRLITIKTIEFLKKYQIIYE